MSDYEWQNSGQAWWFIPAASAGDVTRAIALVWSQREVHHVFMYPGGGERITDIAAVATAEEGKRVAEVLAPIYASMERS